MNLGAFSISLTVKDVRASKAFYEKLGFVDFGGDCGQGWTILKNGDHIIGLFQEMFEKNMLTFNPGWDQSAQNTREFTDIAEIKDALAKQGVEILTDNTAPSGESRHFMIEDPDGNPILFDQHR